MTPDQDRERALHLNALVEAFRQHHGRPPRVLHIGNIANNAYLNAKILIRTGFECDVLCNDYYHIMGCPEWEDADVEGEVRDQNHPDWAKVNLNGFRRPDWFAQGPLDVCANYLTACRTRASLKARFYRVLLALRAGTVPNPLLRYVVTTAARFMRPIASATVTPSLFQKLCSLHSVGPLPYGLLLGSLVLLLKLLLAIPILLVICLVHFVWRLIRFGLRPVRALFARPKDRSRDGEPYHFPQHAARLTQAFRERFPARADALTMDDMVPYRLVTGTLRPLFQEYDAVIGYATAGALPLLCAKRPYYAFEHGTIRNIPFEATTQGRLCAITYRLADASLITNCDNIVAAQRLGLEKFRFIPHPVNEDHVHDEKWRDLRADLVRRLQSEFIVFHPSRQHWEPARHPDWEKGNDIFIRGFARFVKEICPRAGAVFVEWGKKVDESKALLRELGVADRVLWIPPQPNRSMSRYILASDVVADQFYLGAFGSLTPKALFYGRPAMLYVDEARHRWCFDAMPPVINARTDPEVFDGLRRLCLDPAFRDRLAMDGRDWYMKYHSNDVIAGTFLDVFADWLQPGAVS